MKKLVGFDRNNQPIYLGDTVAIYFDECEKDIKIGSGKLIVHNGEWIVINDTETGGFFPYTTHMSMDMGDLGINVVKFVYEKVG